MGRGSSGQIGNSGQRWRTEKKAFGSDGKEIDLSRSPLRYSDDDKTVQGKVRSTIEKFEKLRATNKIEFARTVDANGDIIEDNRGGRGSVKTSVRALNQADTFTHNHPRSAGVIGGTFSVADINNFANYGVRVYRAAASEGTYSISKGKKFDSAGLKNYYKQVSEAAANGAKARNASAKAEYDKVKNSYNAGKATYQQYESAWSKYNSDITRSNNKMLVDLHNGLISGQKKYGYTYTLERRKK